MALKREETARKRRNLTEKKLEDEKVCILMGYLMCHPSDCFTGRDYQPPS